jgi:hypothetical protein
MQLLPDGPRVFDSAASGGLTTTPTELAELVIAVQKALAGTPQGRITPEIAKAMMVRQAGETLPSKCLPSSEPNKPACQSSWGLGFDVNLTKYYEHEQDGERAESTAQPGAPVHVVRDVLLAAFQIFRHEAE